MKKPSYEYRLFYYSNHFNSYWGDQLGWYLYGKQVGFNFGMVAGTIAVILAAYLMYEKGWREEDEDYKWKR